MTSDLQSLQRRFQDYLTGKSEDFEQDIVSTPNALAEHRLGAYYNAYRLRLIDCLATDFPGLQKAIGEQDFEYLVLDYLAAHPSEHPSVRWVGRHMSEFLRHSHYNERDFLTELAAFEWAQGLCFDAGDCELFRLEDMAGIPPQAWPGMQIRMHASVRWLDLYWNAPGWWLAQDKQHELPARQRHDTLQRWLMWRKETRPNWRSLDVAEAYAIEAAAHGANFAEFCEGLLEWSGPEQVAMQAAGFLKQWIADGLVCHISMNE